MTAAARQRRGAPKLRDVGPSKPTAEVCDLCGAQRSAVMLLVDFRMRAEDGGVMRYRAFRCLACSRKTGVGKR